MMFLGFHLGWWALVALIMLVLFAIHSFTSAPRRQRPDTSAFKILSERYAAGELTTEEYDERRAKLSE